MLQSIILQTIFLSFTLLGCSENRNVCGNGNGNGVRLAAMRRSKRGGDDAPINFEKEYDLKALLEKIKADPTFLINKAQLMIMFPWMTSNYIKHATSPRAKFKMPIKRIGHKPFFILNQVLAYVNNPQETKEENTEVKKVKPFKVVT